MAISLGVYPIFRHTQLSMESQHTKGMQFQWIYLHHCKPLQGHIPTLWKLHLHPGPNKVLGPFRLIPSPPAIFVSDGVTRRCKKKTQREARSNNQVVAFVYKRTNFRIHFGFQVRFEKGMSSVPFDRWYGHPQQWTIQVWNIAFPLELACVWDVCYFWAFLSHMLHVWNIYQHLP